jgi:hypothetical protein
MKHLRLLLVLGGVLLLAACASTGPNSASARPVLYPNPALNRMGEAAARAEVDACMARARQSGVTAEAQTNAVGQGAARGAAMGGAGSAVGAVISGRGLPGILASGAAGAAVGGTVGGVAGSFHDHANPTFRRFVQRCVSEKGLEIVGWN